MKNKRFLFAIIFLTALLLTAGYIISQNSKFDAPTNASTITVTEIKRVDFDTFLDSNIVWIPGEENSVAALYSHMERNNTTEFTYHQETSVNAYNLETGEISEAYNLWNYGINMGNGRGFFWSQDGSRLVTDIGGVVDLEEKTGSWINLPKEYGNINVIGISSDGKIILVNGTGEKSGFFIVNADNGQYHLFNMPPSIFSSPFGVLSWSSDGKWMAAQSYDPDHIPKDVIEALNAPQALYLLRADGQEAHLIARNIDGDINSVAFSPDGSKLVWVETHKNNDQFVYIANIDGSGAHEIFSNANLPPEYNITSNILWSPDGNRLVYVGYHGDEFIYPFWILTLGSGETVTPSQ